jgi:hypothetical protein
MAVEFIPAHRSWEGEDVIRINSMCDASFEVDDGILGRETYSDKDDFRTSGFQVISKAVEEWNKMNPVEYGCN